jgi:hypothetical protein
MSNLAPGEESLSYQLRYEASNAQDISNPYDLAWEVATVGVTDYMLHYGESTYVDFPILCHNDRYDYIFSVQLVMGCEYDVWMGGDLAQRDGDTHGSSASITGDYIKSVQLLEAHFLQPPPKFSWKESPQQEDTVHYSDDRTLVFTLENYPAPVWWRDHDFVKLQIFNPAENRWDPATGGCEPTSKSAITTDKLACDELLPQIADLPPSVDQHEPYELEFALNTINLKFSHVSIRVQYSFIALTEGKGESVATTQRVAVQSLYAPEFRWVDSKSNVQHSLQGDKITLTLAGFPPPNMWRFDQDDKVVLQQFDFKSDTWVDVPNEQCECIPNQPDKCLPTGCKFLLPDPKDLPGRTDVERAWVNTFTYVNAQAASASSFVFRVRFEFHILGQGFSAATKISNALQPLTVFGVTSPAEGATVEQHTDSLQIMVPWSHILSSEVGDVSVTENGTPVVASLVRFICTENILSILLTKNVQGKSIKVELSGFKGVNGNTMAPTTYTMAFDVALPPSVPALRPFGLPSPRQESVSTQPEGIVQVSQDWSRMLVPSFGAVLIRAGNVPLTAPTDFQWQTRGVSLVIDILADVRGKDVEVTIKDLQGEDGSLMAQEFVLKFAVAQLPPLTVFGTPLPNPGAVVTQTSGSLSVELLHISVEFSQLLKPTAGEVSILLKSRDGVEDDQELDKSLVNSVTKLNELHASVDYDVRGYELVVTLTGFSGADESTMATEYQWSFSVAAA